MESFKIKNLTFTYPNRESSALDDICLSVNNGEFVTLCGKSGCGKTTLLRLLKSALAPNGDLIGEIYFCGKNLSQTDLKEQAEKIGFVMQDPDNQIVTDKVWHELAFGLESLGYPTPEIRTRVAEMASFFGIESWFHKKVTELSGGQKQLLNLASVMAMQPSVLILDEPTSQLDPISAQEFLKTLEKINRELGTTIILSEHRLEEAFSISDRVVVMDKGKIIADSTPQKVGEILVSQNHDMYQALPTPMRIFWAVDNSLDCPVSVRDGRRWLEEYSKTHTLKTAAVPKPDALPKDTEDVIEIKDVYFRYERSLPDVIKGLNAKIKRGEFFAILGGNGVGKTTVLSLISGINAPYRGEILINGKSLSKVENLYDGVLGVLPQNPQTLFVKKTVYLDLLDILAGKNLTKTEKELCIKNIAALCRIEDLLESHPYDLSGGEQQRAALAKVLLLSPKILLLDEPTKGFDAHFKEIFADIISELKENGVTIVMVSHDIEFCAKYADRCALTFDGNFTSLGTPREFFSGKSFYTTSANRMARTLIPNAVVAEDIILSCGGKVQKQRQTQKHKMATPHSKEEEPQKPKEKHSRLTPLKVFWGSLFALLFMLTTVSLLTDIDLLQLSKIPWMDPITLQLISIAEISAALLCFFPKNEIAADSIKTPLPKRKLTKRTVFSALLVLLAIPFTIYIGSCLLEDKRYYLISILIIFEIMIPFCMVFESKGPRAKELVIISVMSAIAVGGRAAFYMLPQFKPVDALIIIAGVCFGGETGFLVGAITGFVSNFFFGQGPWTPWQMFAFGMMGFIAGVLFKKGLLRKTRASLCVFGFIATLAVYGGIMNLLYIVQSQTAMNFKMIAAAYIAGLPYDLIHAVSTGFFLWFISEPMIEKLERIKIKYGLTEK